MLVCYFKMGDQSKSVGVLSDPKSSSSALALALSRGHRGCSEGIRRQCEAADSGRGPPLSYPGVIRVRREADERGGVALCSS